MPPTNRTVAQGTFPGKQAGFSAFIPDYWDTVLGENLYPNLYLYQFGNKRQVPRNFGFSIKIPRLKKQNIVGLVNGLSEGRVIGTSSLSSEFVSGVLRQFAGAYRHTDIVIMTALSDVIELSLRDIARDIARRMDSHIRDQLSGSGGAIYAGGAATSNVVGTAQAIRTVDILKATTRLDGGDNPRPPDGHYPLVTHPYAIYDLQSSLTGNSWLEINKYGSDSQVQHLYRGEIGRIFGARIVTSTNTSHQGFGSGLAAGTGAGISANASGYRSLMFAPDAYYVTEISDMTAKTFVKQLGSSGALDPVNQIATVGAKVFFTAIPAVWSSSSGEERMMRIFHGGRTPQ